MTIKKEKPHDKHKHLGVTLVEALVAMALIVVVWAAASEAFFAVINLNQIDRDRSTAMMHLNAVMEYMETFQTKEALKS